MGTTTKFWIPFNRPHSTKFGSPDLAARSIPERIRPEQSIPGCFSASQSVSGDVAHYETPLGGSSGGIGTGMGPVPPEEGPSEDSAQQEVDRKNIHILVVEDKYVVLRAYRTFKSEVSPLTFLLQCYQPADRSQNDQKIRIFCECGVEWQGSPRLLTGSSQLGSPETGHYPHGLPDACPRWLSSNPPHPSS